MPRQQPSKRKLTPEQRDRAVKGRQAQINATNYILNKYKDEFEQRLIQERTAAGLPIRTQGPTRAELEERIRKQEQKLEKWREQLRLAS